MALLDEDAGEYFVELLKTKFEEAGLKDFQNILEHLRDDDPKNGTKLQEKTGKESTVVVWDSQSFQMGLTMYMYTHCAKL